MRKKILKFANKIYEKFIPVFPLGFSPFPRTVTFELLYACNLTCPMCYLRAEEVKKKLRPKRILAATEVKKIIDKIPPLISISFTGGEPFLREDIFQILEYAATNHRVGLISNLVLVDKEKIEKLLALNLNALMFSLDGDREHHEKIRGKGTFKKTVSNATYIIKLRNKKGYKNPEVTLNCLIQPSTVVSLHKVAEQAVKTGVDICNFQLYDPSLDRSGYDLHPSLNHLEKDLASKVPKINSKKLSFQLEKVQKILQKSCVRLSFTPKFSIGQIIDYYQGKINIGKAFCHQPYYSFRISPFGEAYPCFNLFVGILLKKSFWEIWNDRKFRQFRKEVKEGKYLSSCVGCCHLKVGDSIKDSPCLDKENP